MADFCAPSHVYFETYNDEEKLRGGTDMNINLGLSINGKLPQILANYFSGS